MDQSEEALAGLLVATARGDRPAFRALYDKTSAKLFGIVLRIVHDRTTASDVLQESYLRIWQKAASFAPAAGRPMTWMIAIAHHAAIDTVRRRVERPLGRHLDGSDPVLELATPAGGEHDILLHDRLIECLDQLGEIAREAVLLAYLDGYSREELAARYERPVPTVKTWLRRALLSLRGCLDAS